MGIYSYAIHGYEGKLVSVEVDLRQGIPGMEIVGLPDSAVRESRERVRIALRNSGYEIPARRILFSLAPADLKKEGAAFDLALALALLIRSGQLREPAPEQAWLVLGELELSGRLRPVNGVTAAAARGLEAGLRRFLVPRANLEEARCLTGGRFCGAEDLRQAAHLLQGGLVDGGGAGEREVPQVPSIRQERNSPAESEAPLPWRWEDLRGQPYLKRALQVAAAGGHHLLVFGPPGCGKTMSGQILPRILPDLTPGAALETTRIHSLTGRRAGNPGLIRRPPFRMPHHSSSEEGLIGGGRNPAPGEVSLAHRGVLFLDEAPEFRKNALQSLREPLTRGRVELSRAANSCWYPAEFQLILAANPCPCGNLGKDDGVCVCSRQEIARYWFRIGGALMDRIDIRAPVEPVEPRLLLEKEGQSGDEVRETVIQARRRQAARNGTAAAGTVPLLNGRLGPDALERLSSMEEDTELYFYKAVKRLGLSSRAMISVLRVARTIADLDGAERLTRSHIGEAVQHRRYGDKDFFWEKL